MLTFALTVAVIIAVMQTRRLHRAQRKLDNAEKRCAVLRQKLDAEVGRRVFRELCAAQEDRQRYDQGRGWFGTIQQDWEQQ